MLPLPYPTSRLVLRRFERADAAPMLPLIGDFEVANGVLRIPHPYTTEDADAFLSMLEREPEKPIAAVTLDGAVIGAVGLELDGVHGRGELGYWIGRPYWGRGYATEAARAMIAIGFTRLSLNKITAHHYTRNPASGRVLEKVGMVREGLLKQHFQRWGRYEDSVAYGLTRDVWEVRCAGT
ncbi:MAG TPA: GNAT family N-acetyltransferase [Phycisphaerales bacterium]|nr:GNAT family N-acetyltransferase [Phycisphaerales bacterium]